MVEALWEEVQRFGEETQPLASFVEKQKQKAQKASLTVIG
jgi:(E)-4-hydroxy-3-methylbut-2-enyl-diphosphate synthase